jgi:hypothetical protein
VEWKLFIQQMFLLSSFLQAEEKADCDQIGDNTQGDCDDETTGLEDEYSIKTQLPHYFYSLKE